MGFGKGRGETARELAKTGMIDNFSIGNGQSNESVPSQFVFVEDLIQFA